MNQYADRINEIINGHQKDNAFWWDNDIPRDDHNVANDARLLIAAMLSGDAQHFKDFVFTEYIDGGNRGWYEEHYAELNEEQKNCLLYTSPSPRD